MTPNLHKILKALTKELTVEVAKMVTEQLRETYVQDVTAIVKTCLRDDQLIKDTGLGFLSIKDLSEKYSVSRQTVSEKCRVFGLERKKSGKHKLVNEKQFLDALQRPVAKPKFLKQPPKSCLKVA